MDGVRRVFDEWAANGRAESMAREHGKTVLRFLDGVRFDGPFTFLDVGCGNGWVVRRIAQVAGCRKAVGIDKSCGMVKNARARAASKKESYVCTDIEGWKYAGRFDCVFSMEAIYYSISVDDAVGKIYRMLKSGGVFICGTDYYKENKATVRWQEAMDVPMHLLSRREWLETFRGAGFQARTRRVKDAKSAKKWRREFGTLFIIGTKP